MSCRTNSVKELEAFAENAIAVNRMILRHMSISEAYQPPSLRLAPASEDLSLSGSYGSTHGFPTFQIDDLTVRSETEEEDGASSGSPRFIIGGEDLSDSNNNLSEETSCERPSQQLFGLSPPSCSNLFKRRMNRNSDKMKVVRSPSAVF